MKRIVSYAMAIALLFMAEAVLAQGYTFRVLANKGSNKLKKGNTGQVLALKTGATLEAGDALIAEEGAYIGLMHKSGKTIEVRKAGTMAVSDLEKNVNTGNTSVASRYAKFVSEKMNEEDGGGYKSKMAATGAVSRALTSGTLDLYLPSSVDVIGDNAIISWEQAPEGTVYVVTVKNIYDAVIYEKETTNPNISLDFTLPEMKNDEGLYIFNVRLKSDETIKSGDVGIRKVNDNPEVLAELKGLKDEIAEDSPLNKLIYASFFEEKGLLLDAMTKYEEAIKMAPEITDFKELYNNFLITNGLSKE